MKADGLKRTPLHRCHVEAGGRLVEFAGWEMPVSYSGILDEHLAVRRGAGLFDVSHMGEIRVDGPGAERFVDWLTPNSVRGLAPGRAQYSALLTERGTYVDDLLVYRLEPDAILLVVNAANTDKDLAWIEERAPGDATVENVSEATALLALQGPRAQEILAPLVAVDLGALRSFRLVSTSISDIAVVVSRTGYTGDDGFEIFVGVDGAVAVWSRLLEAGGGLGLQPVGLGARDSLRLEAGLCLYGHEIDDTVTPLEAGLEWMVKLDAEDFIGRAALLRQREQGVAPRLAGLELEGRRIARAGAAVWGGEDRVGGVTSGTWSPFLERSIAMALLDSGRATVAGEVEVDVRGHRQPARVRELPFYRRPRADSRRSSKT